MIHSTLLVDDNARVRERLREMFEDVGFVCSVWKKVSGGWRKLNRIKFSPRFAD